MANEKETLPGPAPQTRQPGMSRIQAFFRLPGPYLVFLVGLLISRLGDALYTFAIPWISYELTRSAVVLGSLFAVSVLPIVLFGPLVGVAVDRFDRKKLMLAADVLRAVLVALIPVLHMLDLLRLWHLYAVSFILAVLSLMFDVATVAVIPHVAGKNLTRANSGYQLVNQLADLAGPVLAGVLIAGIGGFHTLWLDVVSFGATFLAVVRLPAAGKSVSAKKEGGMFRNLARDLKEGLGWLIRDRLNLSLSLQAMLGNFGYSAAFAVLMAYLLSVLHLDSERSGLNYALIGAGGLLGSMIAVPLEGRFRRGVLIPLLLGMGTVGFLFACLSRFWLAPGIAFALVAACNVAWNTLVMSTRQETVPGEMLGRVLSFSRVFTRLAMPLGAMAGGLIAGFDPVLVFAVAAAAKGLEVVIALVSPIRKL